MSDISKSQQFREFLLQNLPRMGHSGGGGPNLELPSFELTARDYLQFAETELAADSTQSRINCVAHLKRAADCQLDTFLHAYNLFQTVRKANLKFDAKLAFLRDVALFSSRSLARFNEMRNRIEHDYHAPRGPDLEVFYDLVQALVSVLESAMLLLPNNALAEYEIYQSVDEFGMRIGTFRLEYRRADPSFMASWRIHGTGEELEVAVSEVKDFAFFFRAFVLLARRECFRSDQFVLLQLQEPAA